MRNWNFFSRPIVIRKRPGKPRVILNVESLEDRLVPSTIPINNISTAAGLISAINTANGDPTSTYILNLTASSAISFATPNNTFDGNNYLPEITAANITINGNGSTLTGTGTAGNASRFFAIGGTTDALILNDITLSGGSVSGSVLAGDGGAILNLGTLTITGSTISGNSAVSGGGIFSNSGSVSLVNDTIADNSDGLWVSGGTVSLVNDTLAFNTGAGAARTAGTVTAINTLFADNGTAGYSGTITSLGHNDFQDASVTGSSGTDLLSQTSGKVLLEGLANYGGTTDTVALLPGSSALDAGANTTAAPYNLTTDQRGIARKINGVVDIGAYESQGFTLTLTGANAPTEAPAGDTKYRTLIDQTFNNADGSTKQFAVLVTANDPNVNVTGGVISFFPLTSGLTAPTGSTASGTPLSPTVTLTSSGIAMTKVQANNFASAAGGFYYLFASASPNGASLPSTSSAAAVAAGSATVTPAVMEGYIVDGAKLVINEGLADQETVTVTGVTSTTFTATFTKAHGAGFTITSTNTPDWKLFNQKVTTLSLPQQPQNSQSGTTPINFVNGGTSQTLNVTLLDQDGSPVSNANQTVTLQAVYKQPSAAVFKVGTINSANGSNGSFSTVSATAVTGVASFANLEIFQSLFSNLYQFRASYTNPDNSTAVTGLTGTFRVLPLLFTIAGNTFANVGQIAFAVSQVGTNRGTVNLVQLVQKQANGLQTNQILVSAFDYSATAPGNMTPSSLYDGPVFLTFSVPFEYRNSSNALVMVGANVPTQFNFPAIGTSPDGPGTLLINNITPQDLSGLGSFSVTASLTFADSSGTAQVLAGKVTLFRSILGRQR
jgi:hypothetical protein